MHELCTNARLPALALRPSEGTKRVSVSTVQMPMGCAEPFTRTVSIWRQRARMRGERSAAKSADMRIATPYCFVADSSRAAVLTLGER